MSSLPEAPSLTPQQLVELWTFVTSEPPPVLHDEATMLALLEEELAKARETQASAEPPAQHAPE